MFAVITFFKRHHSDHDPAVDAELFHKGLLPIAKGRSPFEHTLDALRYFSLTKLYLMTDAYQEELAALPAYKEFCGEMPCEILTVGSNIDAQFYKLIDECIEDPVEDMLWIRGDLLIYNSVLTKLNAAMQSSYIRTYPAETPSQQYEPLPVSAFIHGEAYTPGAQDGSAAVEIMKISSKYLREFLAAKQSTDESGDGIVSESGERSSFYSFPISPILTPACFAFSANELESHDELPWQVETVAMLERKILCSDAHLMALHRLLHEKKTGSVFLIRDDEADDNQRLICGMLKDAPSFNAAEAGVMADTKADVLARVLRGDVERIVVCGGVTAQRFGWELQCEAAGRDGEQQLPPITAVLSTDCLTHTIQYLRADLILSEPRFSNEVRLLLISYIIATAVSGMLTASRNQASDVLLKVQTQSCFEQSGKMTNQGLVDLALRAGYLESMCGRTVLHRLADAMHETLGWPKAHALCYAAASTLSYIKRYLKTIRPYESLRATAEAYDEIILAAKLGGDVDFADKMLTALAAAGIFPDIRGLAEKVAHSGVRFTEEEQDNTIFSLPPKDVGKLLSACASEQCVAERLALAFGDERSRNALPAATNKFIGTTAAQAKVTVLSQRTRQIQEELLALLCARCEENGLEYRILRNTLRKGDPLESGCYCVLMAPWDIKKLIPLLERDGGDGNAVAVKTQPFVNVFADAFFYRRGTAWETPWNVYVTNANKEIGVAVQSVYPMKKGSSGSARVRLAYRIQAMICKRIGFQGVRGATSSVALIAMMWMLPLGALARLRDALRRTPGRSAAAWSGRGYWDGAALKMVPLELCGGEANSSWHGEPVIQERPTVNDPMQDGLWRLLRKSSRVYIDPSLQGVLNEPAPFKGTSRYAAVKGFVRNVHRKVKAAIKKVTGGVWSGLGSARRAVQPFIKVLRTRIAGRLRGLGLCVSPEAKKLKGYRNRYAGKRCFLIGNGPSLCAEDLNMLTGEVTFGCNFIHRIYPQTDWRPTYHFISDSSTVRTANWDMIRNLDESRTTMVIRDFAYQKMAIRPKNAIVPFSVSIKAYYVSRNFLAYHYISHATVMSMMIEAAMYMGFKEIYLLGVHGTTSSDRGGNFVSNYFTPEQRAKLDKLKKAAVSDYNVERRRQELQERQYTTYCKLRAAAEKRGVHIMNATRNGGLDVFDIVDLDEVLHTEGATRS